MFEWSIEHIIITSSYIGVFLLMAANGFISFPSSQVLYIIAGFFVSTGDLNIWTVSAVGAFGNTAGNVILYELARARGVAYIAKFKMFPLREVKKVQAAFNKRGAWFLFVGKLIPALKVFIPIPAGIARMNRLLYMVIILVSSWLWAFPFLAVGFFFGKSARVFGAYSIILLTVAALVALIFYRYMNSDAVIRETEDEGGYDGNPQR